jgi:hypothetical protein
MFRKYFPYLFAVLAFVAFTAAMVDPPDEPEAKLAKDAAALFDKGKYVDAAPMYQKLLSLNQGNFEYRFRYGACLLYSDPDKSKGLDYLRQCDGRSDISREAIYFLGRAYHLNYRFTEAVNAYERYKAAGDPKKVATFPVDQDIRAARSGRRLLANLTDIVVIDKKHGTMANFFRMYKLDKIGGSLLVVEELKTKEDIKQEHTILVHLPDPKQTDIIYYSSYGKEGKTGKDLYRVKRLPDGSWGQPQILKGPVNTDYDEDYPFMDVAGGYLYFSSKGHNSMGGYDVFRSEYDPNTDTYGAPENLDFAINTPDDDILYMIDADGKRAFFSSTRESGSGRIHVYNVRVERIPVMIAIIKGTFENQIVKNNNAATITITDIATTEVVGIYNASKQNGNYLITLPKGGKYMFAVQSDASGKVHEVTIDVPALTELRAMPQELFLVEAGGLEKLIVRNRFNDLLADNDLIVSEVLKQRASLDPNEDKFPELPSDVSENRTDGNNNQSPDGTNNQNNSDQNTIPPDVSDAAIIKMAADDAKQLRQEANEVKEKMDAAYSVASHYQDQARENASKARDALEFADKTDNPDERAQLLRSAEELNRQSRENSQKANSAVSIARELEDQFKRREQDAKVAEQYAKGIQDAMTGNNRKDAIAKLNEQKDFITEVMNRKEESPEDRASDKRAQLAEKQLEFRRFDRKIEDLKLEERRLQDRIAEQEQRLTTAKKKDKAAIEKDIAQNRDALAAVRSDIAGQEKRKSAASQELAALSAEIDVLEGNVGNVAIKVLSEDERRRLSSDIQSDDVSEVIRQNESQLTASSGQASTTAEKAKAPDYTNFRERQVQAERITDPVKKAEAFAQLERDWIAQIDMDITEAKQQASRQTDQKSKDDWNRIADDLTGLKEVRQNQLRSQEDIIASASSSSSSNGSTTAIPSKSADVLPNYQNRRNEIMQSSVSGSEKNNQLIALENEVIQNAGAQIEAISDRREQGNALPDDEKRQEALLNIIAQAEQNISEIRKSPADVANAGTAITPGNLLSGYDTRRNQIENSNASATAKAEQRIALENELIGAATPTLNRLEEKQQQGNLTPQEEQELSSVLRVISDAENTISQQRQIAAGTSSTGTAITPGNLLSGYDTRRNQIENSNASVTAKAEQRIALENELIGAATPTLNRLEEKQQQGNLTPQEEQELSSVLRVISDAENTISQQRQIAAGTSSTGTAITPGNLLSGYDTRRNQIENSNASATAKAEQRIALENELIGAATPTLNRLEEKQQQGNLTPQEEQELSSVLRVISDAENTISQQRQIAAGTSSTGTAITPGNLLSGYDTRRNQIENSNASATAKAEQRIALENELIGAATPTLNRLEEKQQQGNLTPQEEQELSSVLRVISDAENTISQQRQIAAGTSSTGTAITPAIYYRVTIPAATRLKTVTLRPLPKLSSV